VVGTKHYLDPTLTSIISNKKPEPAARVFYDA
jgi:hypothetical protein